MKVPCRCVEVINMLCHDVPMPQVKSASAGDMRALTCSYRAMINESDICARCKGDCGSATCCNKCRRPLCDDCWSDDGTGMPETLGVPIGIHTNTGKREVCSDLIPEITP